ncbi:MAG: ribosome maturation factor RimP [Alphaproteobacteria bacterium]|nr:ribosome maturation factor RimP [Alphaproteobacteria bacterium]
MSKAAEKKIAGLIAGGIEEAGYDLVRVQITGGGKHATLQIMVDRKDEAGMTVDDCATVSCIVSPILEADADLASRYDLEVSSPGIDRPLVKLGDYKKYAGHLAKIELTAPIDGRRRFQGKIGKVEGDKIQVDTDKGSVTLPYETIEQAKLVLTDELIKAATSGKA